MNEYLKNLNKIEFVVTYACTGNCRHCSEGEHDSCSERIDPQTASDAVKKIASEYDIKTVMAFGGEPLLYTDAVFAIMNTAKNLNIPKRQIITNGFFSKFENKIFNVAKGLADCGVNEVLLSVDAFHQETIPLEIVKKFAKALQSYNVPIKLQPAWLVGVNDNNPYNIKTQQILDSFCNMNIPINDGNIIFPEGNAKIYLSEYFKNDIPQNPYVDDPYDVKCISFSPNGDVLDSNIYQHDVMQIINSYYPKNEVKR